MGTPAAIITSLQNAFEPSSAAAAALGPKQRIPASASASATPATSGASGPTTTRSTVASRAAATIAPTSSRPTSSSLASAAIPGFPGAHRTSGALRGAVQGLDDRVLAGAGAEHQDPRGMAIPLRWSQ